MRAAQFLLLLLVYSASADAASPAGDGRTAGRNSRWQPEYQLAKTPQIYLIFELVGRKILIKARGVVLRELLIESYSVWGTPVQPKPLALVSKSAIRKPKRTEVKPAQKEEKDPSAFPAIQVEDMPARYRLNFDEGIRIYVRPKSEGMLVTVLNLFSFLKSNLITRPIGFLWNELHGENFTEIAVYLNEKDARSLYWAFQEGFSCIIASQ
jgi:hypothetical protein